MAPAPEARRRSLNTATPLYAASTNRRCAARPVACRASISLAAIWSKQRTSNIFYNWEMEWGQVAIFFAVACFAAIVLFMVYRKPRPRGLGQFTACRSWP